jgi:hypothetical protein
MRRNKREVKRDKVERETRGTKESQREMKRGKEWAKRVEDE